MIILQNIQHLIIIIFQCLFVLNFFFDFKISSLFRRRMEVRNERSWMYKRVYNIRYLEGVEEFLQFIKNNTSEEIIC